jgi:hypothetical protein
MPKPQYDDEISAREQAELKALDERAVEIIPRDKRLEDPRLAQFHGQIRGARDHSLRAWADKFDIPERPAPVEHPLAAKLRVRLTAEQARQIRERATAGERERALADEFGVTKNHVRVVIEGRIEPPAEEMIANVLAAERAGRPIAAGLGLIQLQRHGTALPFPPERADELMGALLYRNGLLHCSGCGAELMCACGCGVAYWPEAAARDVTITVTETTAGSVDSAEVLEMPSKIKHAGGRPPTGQALSAAERKRLSRERKKALLNGTAAAPEVEIAKGKILVDPAFFQEDAIDAKTPAEGFENSLIEQAGLAVSLPAFWKKHLGAWQKLRATTVMTTLANEAAETWAMIARELNQKRRK